MMGVCYAKNLSHCYKKNYFIMFDDSINNYIELITKYFIIQIRTYNLFPILHIMFQNLWIFLMEYGSTGSTARNGQNIF